MCATTRSGVDVEYDAICASCLYVKADLRLSMPAAGDRNDRARPKGGGGGDDMVGYFARRCAARSRSLRGSRAPLHARFDVPCFGRNGSERWRVLFGSEQKSPWVKEMSA